MSTAGCFCISLFMSFFYSILFFLSCFVYFVFSMCTQVARKQKCSNLIFESLGRMFFCAHYRRERVPPGVQKWMMSLQCLYAHQTKEHMLAGAVLKRNELSLPDLPIYPLSEALERGGGHEERKVPRTHKNEREERENMRCLRTHAVSESDREREGTYPWKMR